MAIEKYPLGLRTILRSGKSRQMTPTYRLSEPRSGPAYVQALSEDAPVFWDVTFRFQRNERMIFIDWFRRKINRGRSPFMLTIGTEYGPVEHQMQFMPDSLLPVSEDGGQTYTYTATIFSRRLEVPEWADLLGDYADILPAFVTGADIFDIAMNREWPAQ